LVDEVRGEVALVELHAFDHVERRLDGLGFFDGDDAFLADLVHRVGDDVADVGVASWRRWWRPGRLPCCP